MLNQSDKINPTMAVPKTIPWESGLYIDFPSGQSTQEEMQRLYAFCDYTITITITSFLSLKLGHLRKICNLQQFW